MTPTPRRTLAAALALAATVLLGAPPARGQEWLLDDALAALSAETKNELVKGISKAPERALSELLDEETNHLEALAEKDLGPLAQEAWKRLLEAREDGALGKQIKLELARAKAPAGAFLTKVLEEERRRLRTFDERLAYHLVDQALRRTLAERLWRLRDARLTVGRLDLGAASGAGGRAVVDPDTLRNGTHTDWLMANRIMSNGTPAFSWRERRREDGLDLRSGLPLPKFTVWHDEAYLRKVLLEKRYASKLGNLTVVGAGVEGLASARVGRVSMPDEFGREVEGLGATFTARARLTGVRADVRSKDLELHARELGIRTHLNATLVDASSYADATGTVVVNERGAGVRTDLRAGAGVSTSARLPVEIDLRVVTIRVIPYVSAHAGAMAEAHAALEVSWTGLVRFDVGAAVSTGVGVGGGVVLELELGPVLKAALERVIVNLQKIVKPIGDALLGRTWKGPSIESGRLTLSLADLERSWAESSEPPPARHVDTPEQVAARFAPVLYQRAKSEHDLIRRVDFDGDWDTTNNWQNAEGGDRASWVYYDVKETATHWFVTYALYHPRRVSEAIPPLRQLRRHENDMGGCVVVARKGAPRGREVELLLTSNGSRLDGYGPPKGERWDRRDGWWDGELRFIDEANHPLFDLERTHPQVWVEPKDHDVRGFNGRDDGDPFSGDDGVVYVPTGHAETADGLRDPCVGYALRPIAELLEHAGEGRAFTRDDLTRHGLPARLRGDDGPDDSALPPWAWGSDAHGEWEDDPHGRPGDKVRRDPARTILEGDLFADPARAVAILYAPRDFDRTYVAPRAPSFGITDALAR